MSLKKYMILGFRSLTCLTAVLMMFVFNTMDTRAASDSDDVINSGIFIQGIEVSGMTEDEASEAVEAYVGELSDKDITFNIDSHNVTVKASDLGVRWINKGVVKEAANLGKTGNIIQRYKALKDLEHEPKEYTVDIEFDQNSIKNIISEQCNGYDIEPKDASIKRENGQFVITEGQNGIGVDIDESCKLVSDALNEWNRDDVSIDLAVEVVEPKAKSEDFAKVKDVVGSFKTSFTSSGSSRSANITNGAELIDGSVILPGETFSTFDTITPFTAENGYFLAGSYLQGQVVDSFGGGICQVSTTLYNAVLRAELDVTERYNHSMIVGYVDPSADAAISETAGKDFKFVNNTEYPLYIEAIVANKTVEFNIYGCETRPSNRKIEYVSETLTTTQPTGAKYSLDSGIMFGQQKQTQSPHVGYTAKLYKHVYVDGKQTEVEEVNYSSYKAEPAYISVGTAWGDEGAIGVLAAAVATNDPNVVNATLAELAGFVEQAAAMQAQAAAVAEAEAAQAAAIAAQQAAMGE